MELQVELKFVAFVINVSLENPETRLLVFIIK